MSTDPVRIDHQARSHLNDITDGAAAVCFQCGTCTATCPWDTVDDEPLNVRRMMRSAQVGTDGAADLVYRCLTCQACVSRCPRGVDIMGAVQGLREHAFAQDEAPGQLEGALWSVYEEENPLERPASERDAWMAELPDEIDVQVGGEADVLYYVGCAPAYDPALQQVPVAILTLLDAADVDVAVLGAEEACCGDVVRQTGEPDFFEQVAEMNAEQFAATGADTIITSSPHCADTFVNHYDMDVEVRHYTEFLAELVADGQLSFTDADRTVTYHDPCYLARGMSVVEAPRELLAAAGIEVREMADHGADTLCCGGGGGNMFREVELDERFADRRASQAAETAADAIVTACPYCVQTLDDGVKKTGVGLPVEDLATVLVAALDTGGDGDD